METGRPERALLPFTRVMLGISAAVQLLFGVVGLVFTDLWNDVFWSSPLPPWPEEVARFAFLNYLATGIAALFARWQGTWSGALVYFAFSFPYVALSLIAALITAVDPGVPAIMWGYIALSIIYLPAVAYAWVAQTRRGV